MTTKVEVDAHAGWPVKVTKIIAGGTDNERLEETIVAPNTVGTFYVWDGAALAIREMPRDEQVSK